MTYQLVDSDSLDEAGLRRLRAIYEAGFAPHLRAPWSEVSSGRLPNERSFAFVDDADVVGFVLVRTLADTARIFLRYLVVDAERRGQGLGGLLWQELVASCRSAGAEVLIWDVEDPDAAEISAEERSLRLRRIGFYERLGGVLLPVRDYVNPHEHEGQLLWSEMRLLATEVGAAVRADDHTWLKGVVRDVYLHRYELDHREPRVRATLATVDSV